MKKEIALFDREETVTQVANGYELSDTANQLARWLWQFGINHGWIKSDFMDRVRGRRVLIDIDSLPDRVLCAIDAVYRYGETPREILMGPATFRELMNTLALRPMDMLTIDVRYSHHRHLYGIKLVVLPWMEGLLVR